MDRTGQSQAHSAVAKAIKDGRLVRQPCEVCGTTRRVEAHHDDYAKPLDVRWLCASHHMQAHGAGGPMISTRIEVSVNEWRELRKAAIEKDIRTSQLLAELVRKYLKGRK